MTTSNATPGRALTDAEIMECARAYYDALPGCGRPFLDRDDIEWWCRQTRRLLDGEHVEGADPDAAGLLRAKAAEIRARPLPASPASPTADALRLAADRVAQLWADFTSQEMYGEFLREGMSPEDFEQIEDAMQEMRDVLRAASDGRREP